MAAVEPKCSTKLDGAGRDVAEPTQRGGGRHCKGRHCKGRHCKGWHCKGRHCKGRHCKGRHCKGWRILLLVGQWVLSAPPDLLSRQVKCRRDPTYRIAGSSARILQVGSSARILQVGSSARILPIRIDGCGDPNPPGTRQATPHRIHSHIHTTPHPLPHRIHSHTASTPLHTASTPHRIHSTPHPLHTTSTLVSEPGANPWAPTPPPPPQPRNEQRLALRSCYLCRSSRLALEPASKCTNVSACCIGAPVYTRIGKTGSK